jgi:hypothetical protein
MPPVSELDRKEIAVQLLSMDVDEDYLSPQREVVPSTLALAAAPEIPFPDELQPMPQVLEEEPSPDDPLPKADVAVITWTVAEHRALADVLTPGYPAKSWYRYTRNYDAYKPKIRSGAPADKGHRLGTYFRTKVGDKTVLCFKSELHLHQDSIEDPNKPGTATLPVKDLFHQMIKEVQPKWFLTAGTAGGTYGDHCLGDVTVTRAAKFRLNEEFRNEPFAGHIYRSEWEIPTTRFDECLGIMKGFSRNLVEPAFAPPTKRYQFAGGPIPPPSNTPHIRMEGTGGIPEFHPILTTDSFEFGTSANHLEKEGIAVEMGDAVLGMVADELGDAAPKWGVIRNLSDPQINGDLPSQPRLINMQTHWAVWYYETYGYWTSLMGGLVTWAVIAGL